MQVVVKVVVSAVLIVAIAEAAKRSAVLGALLASVPLVSVLAMSWLYVDTGDVEAVARLSTSVFWLVLPSLVLFVALPVLLRQGVGYWPSLAVSVGLTAVAYAGMLPVLRWMGIEA
ncbi:MAG: DUF3147 family protein [Alphaproteobacteria bacterium]|nr:DUF3147 family protein [Alphaproteobacteria bacterium]